MKIFGITFTTKKELKETLVKMREAFPLDIGQIVYEVHLRNAKGRCIKSVPSREYCTIEEVIVDTKNYFSLVERLDCDDVFIDYDEALIYLDFVCRQ
jgi:hypothetical protein